MRIKSALAAAATLVVLGVVPAAANAASGDQLAGSGQAVFGTNLLTAEVGAHSGAAGENPLGHLSQDYNEPIPIFDYYSGSGPVAFMITSDNGAAVAIKAWHYSLLYPTLWESRALGVYDYSKSGQPDKLTMAQCKGTGTAIEAEMYAAQAALEFAKEGFDVQRGNFVVRDTPPSAPATGPQLPPGAVVDVQKGLVRIDLAPGT